MSTTFDFLGRLQVRMAMLAIGRSTLRNQGAAEMVSTARKFLSKLDLQMFSGISRWQFLEQLDAQTMRLAQEFPEGGKGNWGAARKSLNIFLRDVVYSRHLCAHFKLARLEPWLELPLDRDSYTGLLEDVTDSSTVPPWTGVKSLTPQVSAKLQAIAASVAKPLGTYRVHLDVRYWRKDSMDELAR